MWYYRVIISISSSGEGEGPPRLLDELFKSNILLLVKHPEKGRTQVPGKEGSIPKIHACMRLASLAQHTRGRFPHKPNHDQRCHACKSRPAGPPRVHGAYWYRWPCVRGSERASGEIIKFFGSYYLRPRLLVPCIIRAKF